MVALLQEVIKAPVSLLLFCSCCCFLPRMLPPSALPKMARQLSSQLGGGGGQKLHFFLSGAWFRSCTHCCFLYVNDQNLSLLSLLAARDAGL